MINLYLFRNCYFIKKLIFIGLGVQDPFDIAYKLTIVESNHDCVGEGKILLENIKEIFEKTGRDQDELRWVERDKARRSEVKGCEDDLLYQTE